MFYLLTWLLALECCFICFDLFLCYIFFHFGADHLWRTYYLSEKLGHADHRSVAYAPGRLYRRTDKQEGW
jgi:hypothetical protein